MPAAVTEALGDPAKVQEALLACLPPRMRSSLRRSRDGLDSLEIIGDLDQGDVDLVKAWLAVIDAPMQRPALVQELTRCLLLTAAQKRDQMDLKLMLAALVEELSDLPEDALRAALRQWPRQQKWWPTLAEIRELAKRQMGIRISLRHWLSADEKIRRLMISHYMAR
jgi:hypothetical protein